MRFLGFILLVCLSYIIPATGQAQTLSGVVMDGQTKKPLYPAGIVNLANGQTAATDGDGKYSIPAKAGDVISYSFIEYHNAQRLAYPDSFLQVELFPLSVELQEFILRPDYTPYQKDSAEMSVLYSKELNMKQIKPGLSGGSDNGFGVSASGLIGSMAQKMSKSYKRNKKFKKTFKKDMEQKYIDTKYAPGLVTALTGFTGDTLAVFMNAYPMEYTFARASTDLELKMWIRNNYKEYLEKNNFRPQVQAEKR
jgi:hypothetical protein